MAEGIKDPSVSGYCVRWWEGKTRKWFPRMGINPMLKGEQVVDGMIKVYESNYYHDKDLAERRLRQLVNAGHEEAVMYSCTY